MKRAVGAHGATASYAGRSFINEHGSHLLSMFTPSYSAFMVLCAKRLAVQTARHRLSKKSACGGLFRQVCAVSLSPLRGSRAGNAVSKPCCARLPKPPRMSLDSDFTRRAAALRTSQKGFLTVCGAPCKQRAKLFPSVPLWRRRDPRSPPVCVSAGSISLRSGRESACQAAIRPPTLSTIISTSVSSPVSASMYTRYSRSS